MSFNFKRAAVPAIVTAVIAADLFGSPEPITLASFTIVGFAAAMVILGLLWWLAPVSSGPKWKQKMRIWFVAIAAASAACLTFQSAVAENIAMARRGSIRAEIKKLPDHEWAGEYYAGDGLGVNTSLAIAPRSGFVIEWHGCLGLYDQNYGRVKKSNGQLRLAFTFKNKKKGLHGIASALVPVSWGPRRYLIPADDLAGFCNSINDGREPRMSVQGNYLLRRGDEAKEVVGFPNLPVEFRASLVVKPI